MTKENTEDTERIELVADLLISQDRMQVLVNKAVAATFAKWRKIAALTQLCKHLERYVGRCAITRWISRHHFSMISRLQGAYPAYLINQVVLTQYQRHQAAVGWHDDESDMNIWDSWDRGDTRNAALGSRMSLTFRALALEGSRPDRVQVARRQGTNQTQPTTIQDED